MFCKSLRPIVDSLNILQGSRRREKKHTANGGLDSSSYYFPYIRRSTKTNPAFTAQKNEKDSMTFAHSSAHRAHSCGILPTWVATTTSRPRRPWACFAQGSAACGVMRPFSPGATSPWIAAASSLAYSHPPPAPRVRVATPVLLSSNFENYDLFHAQSTDTGRGVHARLWRTNQTSTSGVSFLGFVRGCNCWLCC